MPANVAALQVELTPLGWSDRIEIRSLIDGAVENAGVARDRFYSGRHLQIRRLEKAGRPILIEKVAVILTSRDPAISEPDEAACGPVAELPDFDGLLDAHRNAWRRIWKRSGFHAGEGGNTWLPARRSGCRSPGMPRL